MADIDQSYNELIAGEVKTLALPLDKDNATAAIGQVLKYDQAAHNWVDATDLVPGANGTPVVVCAEAKTLTDDDRVLCIVSGDVNFNKLDATSRAFNNIEALLINSGIRPIRSVSN